MDDFDYIGFEDEESKQTEDYIGSANTPVDKSKINEYLFNEAEKAYEEELERQRKIAALEYEGNAIDMVPTEDYVGTVTSSKDDFESMEYMPGEHKGYGM